MKSDTYENIDANPQLLADRLAKKLNVSVELYDVSSEGAIIEALRFGHADIGFMDGGLHGLAGRIRFEALAADLKPDGRSWYGAQAYVELTATWHKPSSTTMIQLIRSHCLRVKPRVILGG